jgi:uncharacterized protein YcbX
MLFCFRSGGAGRMSEVLLLDFPTFLVFFLAIVVIYRLVKPRLSRSVASPPAASVLALPDSKVVNGAPIIGHVSQLWIFPIKSCPGISVQSAKIGARGFEFDRQLMLVRASGEEDGEEALPFVTLRNMHRLSEFAVSVEGNTIVVKHKEGGLLRVEPGDGSDNASVLCRIWDDEVRCVPVSKEADEFFSKSMGVRLRLVRVGQSFERQFPPSLQDTAVRADTGFGDLFPYLLTSTASLAAVSKKVGESIDMRRFRSNIVMKTDTPAFEEDQMAELKIGEHAVFRNLKCCSRCKVPRLSPEDGTEDARGQPTKALIELNHFFKEDAYFGVNLAHALGMEV